MRLAIGDVVRDRTDSAVGTVAGLATHSDGPLVALQVSEDLRLAEPEDLDVVARVASPATSGTNAVRAAGYLVAALNAYIAAHSARALGADWALTALSGAGGYSAITCAVRWLLSLANPRRFRV